MSKPLCAWKKNTDRSVQTAVDRQMSQLQLVLAYFKGMAMFEDCELTCPESHATDGDTPLHIAAFDGRFDLLSIMLPFVQNIDVPGDLGNTPLHYTVLKNHVEVARFLLNRGADINRGNDYDDTPLELMKENPAFEAIVQEQ
jgi:hypothetical protein